jgi:hypothetical protein
MLITIKKTAVCKHLARMEKTPLNNQVNGNLEAIIKLY